jgi:hypothetical protein
LGGGSFASSGGAADSRDGNKLGGVSWFHGHEVFVVDAYDTSKKDFSVFFFCFFPYRKNGVWGKPWFVNNAICLHDEMRSIVLFFILFFWGAWGDLGIADPGDEKEPTPVCSHDAPLENPTKQTNAKKNIDCTRIREEKEKGKKESSPIPVLASWIIITS